MNIIKKITNGTIPKHIAIIMDGNGRWALERGENRFYGHKQGVKTVFQSFGDALGGLERSGRSEGRIST